MQIVYEQRACSVLYNILTSLDNNSAFLLPANVCPIVVATFLKAGRKIEFIDISESTLCIDEKKTIQKIKANPSEYAGLLFVRSYGIEKSFDVFFRKVKSLCKNLIIIDDRCLSVPSFEIQPKIADVNLYSTGYSKFVDLGYGGFAILKDNIKYNTSELCFLENDLVKLNNTFKNAIDKRESLDFEIIELDWLDTSKPAIDFTDYSKMVIDKYKLNKSIKEKFNSIYIKNLPKNVQLDPVYQNWRFNIIVSDKEILMKKIFDAGLFASSHYASVNRMFYNRNSKVTELVYSKIVNLFSDQYFKFENIDKLINIINKHINK